MRYSPLGFVGGRWGLIPRKGDCSAVISFRVFSIDGSLIEAGHLVDSVFRLSACPRAAGGFHFKCKG